MARGQSQQHLRGRTVEEEAELDERGQPRGATDGEGPGEDPDIVKGGPGDTEQDTQQGAAWQPFKYGDKTFGSEKELTDYLGDLDKQIREARRPTETPPPQKPEDKPTPKYAADGIDWDTEFYKSPKAAVQKFEQALTEKIRGELTQQYQADTNMRAFWQEYFKQFPDMEKRAQVSGMVLQRDWKELSEMPVDRCRDELKKRTMKQLEDWGAAPERTPPTQHRTTVESGGTRQQGQSQERQQPSSRADKPPASLSAMIRQRAEQRRQAAANRTQVS